MARFLAGLIGCLILSALPAAGAEYRRLLTPKAPPPAGPRSLAELREQFENVPPDFRPMPLWVWNDAMTPEAIAGQLRQFRDAGFGGVFIHPRPGLVTEYLSDEWFRLWRYALEEGKRLGLSVHIYDENSYPSGFAGGHVPALDPTTAGSTAAAALLEPGQRIDWSSVVAAARVALDSSGVPASYEALPFGASLKAAERAAVFTLQTVAPRAFTAWFPYVDLTNPRTAELFLKTTYERYRGHFGPEFGKTVRMAFSDEPELPKAQGLTLPLSRQNLLQFRLRRGYRLEDHLASLWWNAGDYRKVRFDYWETMHELLAENFFGPMYDWCDNNGLWWTGHWWEHLWPSPYITPADGAFYAFQHVPGIDVLWTPGLRETGQDPQNLLVIRQVASAARQLGRPRVLSEAFGGNGWDATPAYFKLAGDWQIVHGVNLINPHLAHASIRGARKRDWPQSFSEPAAWWPLIRQFSAHTARLSLAMSSGESRNRIAVLMPSTSGYLLAGRTESAQKDLEKLRESFNGLVQHLADHQIDFDLVNEYFLEWFGGVSGARLLVGRADYDVLVLPAGLENLRSGAVPVLEKYLAGGGRVMALSNPPEFVDGRASGRLTELARSHAALWNRIDPPKLVSALDRLAPPRFRLARRANPGVSVAERWLEGGGRLILVTNSRPDRFVSSLEVSEPRITRLDTETGYEQALPLSAVSGGWRTGLDLGPGGTAVFALTGGAAATPPPPQPEKKILTGLKWRARRESANVAVLDFCDLETGGQRFDNIHTTKASELVYRAHGFPSNPWDRTIQYRNVFTDRNRYGPGTGFQAVFRFQLDDPAALPGLKLAVELPEKYRILLNGKPVEFRNARPWMDPGLKAASVEAMAKIGLNEVRMEADPFDVHMELENIYVLGEFGVRAADPGFVLTAPREPGLGSWKQQLMPFYPGVVVYETEIRVDPGIDELEVHLEGVQASAVEVLAGGDRRAALLWAPWIAKIPVESGIQRLAVRVAATPWNVLGPLHARQSRNQLIFWPGLTALVAPQRQPAGDQYRFVDYGLEKWPEVRAGRRAR